MKIYKKINKQDIITIIRKVFNNNNFSIACSSFVFQENEYFIVTKLEKNKIKNIGHFIVGNENIEFITNYRFTLNQYETIINEIKNENK